MENSAMKTVLLILLKAVEQLFDTEPSCIFGEAQCLYLLSEKPLPATGLTAGPARRNILCKTAFSVLAEISIFTPGKILESV